MTIYERAINYIMVHGWCQNSFVNSTGQVCLIGALDKVAVDNDEWRNAWETLKQKLGTESLLTWNDAPERTEKDIINLLEGMQ